MRAVAQDRIQVHGRVQSGATRWGGGGHLCDEPLPVRQLLILCPEATLHGGVKEHHTWVAVEACMHTRGGWRVSR